MTHERTVLDMRAMQNAKRTAGITEKEKRQRHREWQDRAKELVAELPSLSNGAMMLFLPCAVLCCVCSCACVSPHQSLHLIFGLRSTRTLQRWQNLTRPSITATCAVSVVMYEQLRLQSHHIQCLTSDVVFLKQMPESSWDLQRRGCNLGPSPTGKLRMPALQG